MTLLNTNFFLPIRAPFSGLILLIEAELGIIEVHDLPGGSLIR